MGFVKKENVGLDTETYNGYVKLICDSYGRNLFIENIEDKNNMDKLLKFLSYRGNSDEHTGYTNVYNWFYNIQFDFESIVKYLDITDLKELYNSNRLQYGNYQITYLPKKFFSIQDNNNHRFYFFDMYNFLDVSLNKASKKFLKDEKISTVNAHLLNTDLEYWDKNREDIIKYCLKDAELTKKLADYFWSIVYEKLNFYPKSPMSKGKLSEEYFLHTCNIPYLYPPSPVFKSIPEKVIKLAYDSYYGGRFELLKRGYMDRCYCYDIKSAYPSEIASLPDFNKGKWEKVTELNPNAHTGFYKCKVMAFEDNFSPFKQKLNTLNIFPNGVYTQFMAKKEVEFYESRFGNSAIKIEFGYEWEPNSLIYPFKSEIERLYQWKESEPDPDIKYCVKIILNSLYGKFIQVSGDNNTTGRLFNPLYAALITAGCRIKILDLASQKADSVISFSTDSVISLEPLNVPVNPSLGQFQKDFEGMGVFVMSDVYNLWNDETKKVKTKLRGFSVASTKDYDSSESYLKDILSNMDSDIYDYVSKRPYHIGECLRHVKKRSIEDINKFGEVKKHIDVNGDNKRLWDKDFKTGKDCLKEMHESKPLMIEV